jgi:hypothetical protein
MIERLFCASVVLRAARPAGALARPVAKRWALPVDRVIELPDDGIGRVGERLHREVLVLAAADLLAAEFLGDLLCVVIAAALAITLRAVSERDPKSVHLNFPYVLSGLAVDLLLCASVRAKAEFGKRFFDRRLWHDDIQVSRDLLRHHKSFFALELKHAEVWVEPFAFDLTVRPDNLERFVPIAILRRPILRQPLCSIDVHSSFPFDPRQMRPQDSVCDLVIAGRVMERESQAERVNSLGCPPQKLVAGVVLLVVMPGTAARSICRKPSQPRRFLACRG